MSTHVNYAAWMLNTKEPFSVQEAPYPKPSADEIVIQSKAVAITQDDRYYQEGNEMIYKELPIPIPNILGHDVAGIVCEIGANVTKFKPGDRVMAHVLHMHTGKPEHGAFQNYVLAHQHQTAIVPDNIELTNSAAIPLALSTVTNSLYELLKLKLPTPEKSNEIHGAVLIWGGASSVGANAIQLAKISGYKVITTASPRNAEYLKTIGADVVIDYNDEYVEQHIIDAIGALPYAGAWDPIVNDSSLKTELKVADRVKSIDGIKHIILGLPYPGTPPEGYHIELAYGFPFERPISKYMYHEYITEAIQNGTFKIVPHVKFVGESLNDLTAAVADQANARCEKYIVTI
ncbi:hypothetical protein NQZ79_g2707 [Umbelopsis isabellina]|nr:hypothetical protein NQZ79_g2707 [Umbelopsis isabellina]